MHLSAFSSRKDLRLRIVATATGNTIHAWTLEEGRGFLVDSVCPSCLAPDHDHMLSDKSTCPHQIAVGAVDAAGREAWFTSRGPGLASRPKPDVSAPGIGLVSALNSAAGSWPVSGSLGGYRWGPMSGTSMSTPLVTGALALLLEANPKLGTDSALILLKGGATAHDHGIGWSVLDLLGMFRALDPSPPVVGLASSAQVRQPVVQEWITAQGKRIRVPQGSDPFGFQPEGIAWLRSCKAASCSLQGRVKP